VATAVLLRERGETDGEVALSTKSGRVLRVRLEEHTLSGWHPTLSGEARIVYQGTLGEL
jgi:hypothetical protein